jgi:hypothetical protein
VCFFWQRMFLSLCFHIQLVLLHWGTPHFQPQQQRQQRQQQQQQQQTDHRYGWDRDPAGEAAAMETSFTSSPSLSSPDNGGGDAHGAAEVEELLHQVTAGSKGFDVEGLLQRMTAESSGGGGGGGGGDCGSGAFGAVSGSGSGVSHGGAVQVELS